MTTTIDLLLDFDLLATKAIRIADTRALRAARNFSYLFETARTDTDTVLVSNSGIRFFFSTQFSHIQHFDFSIESGLIAML